MQTAHWRIDLSCPVARRPMSEPSSCFPRRRQGFDPMHEAWVRWWVATIRLEGHPPLASSDDEEPMGDNAPLLAPRRLLVQSLGPGKNRSLGASPSTRAYLYSEARSRSVARHRHTMSPDILKRKCGGHLSREACRQAADLRVDISEVGQRRPTANPHDRAVRRPTKLHGHGSPGPEAVRRYSV